MLARHAQQRLCRCLQPVVHSAVFGDPAFEARSPVESAIPFFKSASAKRQPQPLCGERRSLEALRLCGSDLWTPVCQEAIDLGAVDLGKGMAAIWATTIVWALIAVPDSCTR